MPTGSGWEAGASLGNTEARLRREDFDADGGRVARIIGKVECVVIRSDREVKRHFRVGIDD